MARSARKEREIKEREELILDVGRRILLDEGFAALTMDRIAAEIEYSKGTVYQHFAGKADVLAALAARTHEKRTGFFERAATFNGTPRERIMAVGVADDLFVRLFPSHFRAEQIILLTGDTDTVAGERIEACFSHEARCFQICTGIVRDGVARGDLVLEPPMSIEGLTFGLWSSSFGVHYLGGVLERFDGPDMGGDPFVVLGANINAMLDGHGFRPLSSEHDYFETMDRVRREIFSEELAELEGD